MIKRFILSIIYCIAYILNVLQSQGLKQYQMYLTANNNIVDIILVEIE